MIIKTKDPRRQEGRFKDFKKLNFRSWLNMNWNGILELPTFIWCNKNDAKKKKKSGLFDTFFPKGKLSPKGDKRLKRQNE